MTTPQHPQDEIRQEIYDAIHVGFFVDDADDLAVDVCNDTTEAVLAALSAAGYRIIQTDQAEHGDQLVQIERTAWEEDSYGGHLVSALSSNYQPAGALVFRLRRVAGNTPAAACERCSACGKELPTTGPYFWPCPDCGSGVAQPTEDRHLHTYGVDRGDCPQCEAEYGAAAQPTEETS